MTEVPLNVPTAGLSVRLGDPVTAQLSVLVWPAVTVAFRSAANGYAALAVWLAGKRICCAIAFWAALAFWPGFGTD